MIEASKFPAIELHDALMGRSPLTLFSDERLQEDLGLVRAMAASQRLLEDEWLDQGHHWRDLACGESDLQSWWPPTRVSQQALREFVGIVSASANWSEPEIRDASLRLRHLLALACIRLKLEPLAELASAVADELGLALLRSGFVDAREIAAVCQLRVATVRNAISRREMTLTRGKGIEIGAALDWMVQRRGFLYSSINAMSADRRINGLLACRRLQADPKVETLRQVSRLRLTLWRVKASGRCFGINAEGLHHCLITLPAADAVTLIADRLVNFEDRTADPAIRLYRQCFQSTSDPILQAVVPNMAVLDALMDRLGVTESVMPVITR